MTENSYGAGSQCSGATLSVSPFATTSVAIKRPQDYIFPTPVYNEAQMMMATSQMRVRVYILEKITVETRILHLLILE